MNSSNEPFRLHHEVRRYFPTDDKIMESFGPATLDWFLNYEIEAARRYRRYVSLAMLTGIRHPVIVKRMVRSLVRSCDTLISNHDSIVIVMTETNNEGAQAALNRMMAEITEHDKLYSAVVSYPQDGHTSSALLQVARYRLFQSRKTTHH